MSNTRPRAYEIPSYRLALHFGRKPRILYASDFEVFEHGEFVPASKSETFGHKETE